MTNTLDDIRAAIDSFDLDRARQLLREAFQNPDAETYFLASRAAIDDDQRVEFLQKAVELDPFHEKARNGLKKLNTSSSPPPPANTAPSEPVANNQESEPMILGIINAATPLYVIPHTKGTVRTQLSAGAKVSPLARDVYNEWYNVLYLGTTGKPILGWIEAEKLADVSLNDSAVNLYDLPLTEYEYMSRTELEELKRKRGIQSISRRIVYSNAFRGAMVLLLIGIAASMIALPIHNTYEFRGPGPYAEYIFAAGLGLSFLGLTLLIISQHEVNTQLSQLQRQINTMKSSTEVAYEMQARQAALNLAGNVVTRMVPNRQDVTVRRR
jgi:hypothetical protein